MLTDTEQKTVHTNSHLCTPVHLCAGDMYGKVIMSEKEKRNSPYAEQRKVATLTSENQIANKLLFYEEPIVKRVEMWYSANE